MRSFFILSSIAYFGVACCYSRNANGSEVFDGVNCIDREGRTVANGERFAPDEDPCKTCDCVDGSAQLCTLVQCSPPACPKWEPIRNESCKFRCLDGSHGGDLGGPGFDLRLALSGTTSLLIVALLIFMVHRLRQRRLLILMNRMTEEQHCIDHDESPFAADEVAGFDFLSYKDPPPPYSSPHQTLDRRYDPPPYETATTDTSTRTLLDGRSPAYSNLASSSAMAAVVQNRGAENSQPESEESLSRGTSLATFYSHV
jgi:hypothetical protein